MINLLDITQQAANRKKAIDFKYHGNFLFNYFNNNNNNALDVAGFPRYPNRFLKSNLMHWGIKSYVLNRKHIIGFSFKKRQGEFTLFYKVPRQQNLIQRLVSGCG